MSLSLFHCGSIASELVLPSAAGLCFTCSSQVSAMGMHVVRISRMLKFGSILDHLTSLGLSSLCLLRLELIEFFTILFNEEFDCFEFHFGQIEIETENLKFDEAVFKPLDGAFCPRHVVSG